MKFIRIPPSCSAASIASRIASFASSIFTITPLRRPADFFDEVAIKTNANKIATSNVEEKIYEEIKKLLK